MRHGRKREPLPAIYAIGGIANLVCIASFGAWAPLLDSRRVPGFILWVLFGLLVVSFSAFLWGFIESVDWSRKSER